MILVELYAMKVIISPGCLKPCPQCRNGAIRELEQARRIC
jgi:hypothetical protein